MLQQYCRVLRLAALGVVFAFLAAAGEVSIRLEGGAYRVSGWTPPAAEPKEGWPSVFAVYAGGDDAPAMLGTYGIEGGELAFRPRFTPAAGVPIRAVFRPPGAPQVVTSFRSTRPPEGPATRVLAVYPSSGVLPANQLKFYIRFSAPMRRGEAWQHLRLLDESGKAVDLPFLEIDQELWDRDQTRLTVLFDPGRIKRGVLPLEESGPAIRAGKHYTLVVDEGWRDARGLRLERGFRKPIQVATELRAAIDPARWRLTPPEAGTTDPLVVKFERPMDWALAQRMIQVQGVAGEVTLHGEETEWRFTPSSPWTAGLYNLNVDTALEDLAGNKVGRPFDVDTFERISVRVERETVSVPFRIRGK